MHDIGQQLALNEQLTATECLRFALGVQININPAGEEVFGVPLTLAVTQEDQGAGHDTTDRSGRWSPRSQVVFMAASLVANSSARCWPISFSDARRGQDA